MTPEEFAQVYLKTEFHQLFLDAVSAGNPPTINQKFGTGSTEHYSLSDLKSFIKTEWKKDQTKKNK